MNRREVLGGIAAVGIVGFSGCASVGCSVSGNLDRLRLEPVSDGVGQASNTIIIQYRDLNTSAQRVVRRAAETGNYRQCHKTSEGMSGIEALFIHISNRYEELNESSTPPGHRTYLAYDGTYYGIEIDIVDVSAVDSIPESSDSA